jgi:hypothetical protein
VLGDFWRKLQREISDSAAQICDDTTVFEFQVLNHIVWPLPAVAFTLY